MFARASASVPLAGASSNRASSRERAKDALRASIAYGSSPDVIERRVRAIIGMQAASSDEPGPSNMRAYTGAGLWIAGSVDNIAAATPEALTNGMTKLVDYVESIASSIAGFAGGSAR